MKMFIYLCNMELQIKDVAKKKNTSMQDLSKALGISYQAFNQKLNRKPNIEFIQKCADALDCSVFELIVPDRDLFPLYDKDGVFKGVIRAVE
ncbi:helix-turn-helix domain-containing protein [Chryseobacterium sp. DT-3]|uniref:helix-turn-helix domain-containing protein n=1 Tax=Chryseobacterium sp. DT-3 TaxID=3396164 RepID=UPI003F1D2F1D